MPVAVIIGSSILPMEEVIVITFSKGSRQLAFIVAFKLLKLIAGNVSVILTVILMLLSLRQSEEI